MGCWNETCMVSNLPIRAGDRIVAIPIIESSDKNPRGTYSAAYWAPFLPFVRGEYDDYGSIENTDDYVFEQVAKKFLPEGDELLDVIGADFINEFVRQLPLAECACGLAQKTRIAFIHETIFDDMIQKSADAKEGWKLVCDASQPFTKAWRFANGVYFHYHPVYPTSRMLISYLLVLNAEKRIEEMTKFTYALNELRMGYHPSVGFGGQEGVTNFMLEMKEKIAEMAKLMKNEE